jgi:pyridoxamine 5'-phosphate oxidase
MINLADLRKTYSKGSLSENDAMKDPLELFALWFDQASKAKCPEPHAMSLATVNQAGVPSIRTVLLKGLEDKGFVFYTNYLSQKGLRWPGIIMLLFYFSGMN